MLRTVAVGLGLLLILTAPGCGPRRPEVAKVHGRITVAGKPITTGTIQFWPESGRPAQGQIQEDGAYTLTTFDPGDGAVLGKHTVTIEATKIHNPGRTASTIDEEFVVFKDPNALKGKAVIERLVPERFSKPDTSGLTKEVSRGDNPIDFDLPAK